jgi:iron complex outermembrane receptor protein
MKKIREPFVLSAIALAVAGTAHAQLVPPTTQRTPAPGTATTLPEVVVTGNPLGSELFDLALPVSTLSGSELMMRRSSTIGETLNGLPGVTSTQFGPNASRPVIRGLDADRIRILSGGSAVLDASSLSFDHDVAVDPLTIERAEVVRGPAALLYGGSAVGGVVNLIDNRIPQSPLKGITGRAEGRYGGADREKSVGGLFEIGNGRFALHADAYTRDTDDLRIPGFARSARLRALDPQPDEPRDVLPNSASSSHGGALGGSVTWDRGYFGVSYGDLEKRYGTVAEPEVTIDMRNSRFDVASEARELGSIISGVKFKLGHTDYKHTELDAGTPATEFRSKGYDARIEAQHGRIGPLRGAFGVQVTDFDFSALGAEAFVPSTNTDSRAVFLYEELPLGNLKLSLGGRHERTEVRTAGGGPDDPNTGTPRFGPAEERTFNANSGSVGAVYSFTPNVALAVNAGYTQRAPTFYELYANGPHAATGVFEVGNPATGKETARTIDAALRVKQGAHSGSLSVFQSRFSNFITLFSSGNTRGADGELNPVDDDGDGVADGSGEEILPEFVYRGTGARFRGYELEGKFRLLERPGLLDLLLRFDYVRAEDRTANVPLPRIAPRRYSAALAWQQERFGANLEATYVGSQDRVSANELPTDSYTMVNAALTYTVKLAAPAATAVFFVRGINLLDEEARNHVSFLKDIAPLGKRAGQIGVRAQF